MGGSDMEHAVPGGDVQAPISSELQTRYDRQMRLWGVDAQMRMMRSKVLIVNIGGLGTELAKNLVLGGIGEVTLCDTHTMTEEDLSCNFLAGALGAAAVGKNRAEASQRECQDMNQHVKVTALSTPPAEVDVAGYDVVCATDLSREEAIAMNKRCREAGTAFVACNSFGMLALAFSDFGDNFTATVVDPTDKGVKHKVISNFIPLERAFATPEGTKRSWVPVKPLPSFVACQVLWAAGCHQLLSQPPPIRTVAEQLCKEHGLDMAKVLPEAVLSRIEGFSGGHWAPVCAMAGGIIAQEVLKVVQMNAKPMVNFFVYDGLFESKGYSERIA